MQLKPQHTWEVRHLEFHSTSMMTPDALGRTHEGIKHKQMKHETSWDGHMHRQMCTWMSCQTTCILHMCFHRSNQIWWLLLEEGTRSLLIPTAPKPPIVAFVSNDCTSFRCSYSNSIAFATPSSDDCHGCDSVKDSWNESKWLRKRETVPARDPILNKH